MLRIIAMLLTGIILTWSTVWAQGNETPGIDRRQANQERRIQEGVASGQLTPGEAARLERNADRIEKMEERAKADGVVTPRERARLHEALDRQSRAIAREKHDAQGKRRR